MSKLYRELFFWTKLHGLLHLQYWLLDQSTVLSGKLFLIKMGLVFILQTVWPVRYSFLVAQSVFCPPRFSINSIYNFFVFPVYFFPFLLSLCFVSLISILSFSMKITRDDPIGNIMKISDTYVEWSTDSSLLDTGTEQVWSYLIEYPHYPNEDWYFYLDRNVDHVYPLQKIPDSHPKKLFKPFCPLKYNYAIRMITIFFFKDVNPGACSSSASLEKMVAEEPWNLVLYWWSWMFITARMPLKSSKRGEDVLV